MLNAPALNRKTKTYSINKKRYLCNGRSSNLSGISIFNHLKIEDTKHVAVLPKRNVLFVSNHQTYFADIIVFIHILCAVKWRKPNHLGGIPYYLLNSFTHVYFVAAEETMRSSWISSCLFWPVH